MLWKTNKNKQNHDIQGFVIFVLKPETNENNRTDQSPGL